MKDGDTCCTKSFLNDALFWQYVKGLKNKINTDVRRNLEEILEVKIFLKMSIGFCSILGCVHFNTTSRDKEK